MENVILFIIKMYLLFKSWKAMEETLDMSKAMKSVRKSSIFLFMWNSGEKAQLWRQ
jgi:hypothetical protein